MEGQLTKEAQTDVDENVSFFITSFPGRHTLTLQQASLSLETTNRRCEKPNELPLRRGIWRARGRPGVCRGSRFRRLRSLRRGWRPVARSEMTPPGPTGAELERVGTSETNGVENSCSAVVMLLQCTTKNGDAIQNHRGCRVIRAHGMSHAPPPCFASDPFPTGARFSTSTTR